MERTTINRWSREIADLLAEKVGAKGDTLGARIDGAAPALPPEILARARFLAAAEIVSRLPDRSEGIDLDRVEAAYGTVRAWLMTEDRETLRLALRRAIWRKRLVNVGCIAIAALIAWVVWREVL